MPSLYWLLLMVSLAMFVFAWRVLARDAREGYDVSMGGAMYFSSVWMLASALTAIPFVGLLGLAWWWGLVLFIGLMLFKSVIYRIVVALNLGIDAPPLPKNGFKEFSRKAEQIRSEQGESQKE